MINQSFSSTHERFYECLECQEAIFNPICPNCLAFQINVWLSSYPDLGQKILPEIKDYLKKIYNTIDYATRCIACNKKTAILCPYCFTEHVLDILKKNNLNKQVLIEFLSFFNFDFQHTGYSKEAEKLGMY